MISLKESLQDLMEVSANKVLIEGSTLEGTQALHRMTLLLSMIERLDAGGDRWAGFNMLPCQVPLMSDLDDGSDIT